MKFSISTIFSLITVLSVVKGANAVPHSNRRHSSRNLQTRASNWAHWGDRLRTGKIVRAVNLGGWFILENWMSPDLFLTPDLANQTIPDEWTFSKVITSQSGRAELESRLKKHWATWIVELDFAKMQEAGLNTVRLVIGHWAMNASSSEPYLATAQRPYIRQALRWAEKYGLDVVLDLHGLPHSQNGYDNSGRAGNIGFGESDIPRALDVLSKLVKFYVNEDFGGVVKAIELANEPKIGDGAIPKDVLLSYNRQAYATVRSSMTSAAKTRVTVFISDAFQDIGSTSAYDSIFSEFNPASIVADWHTYQAFGDLAKLTDDEHIDYTCSLASKIQPQVKKRPLVVGEWSIGKTTSCTPYSDCKGKTMKQSINELNTKDGNIFQRRFFEAQASTFELAGGWIFWNWKTASVAAWSYKDAWQQGWIPSNVSDLSTWSYFPSSNSSSCVSPKDNPNTPPKFRTQSPKGNNLLQASHKSNQREWE